MSAEAVNAYFTPLDYFMYLGAILVVLITYYQWRWWKDCKDNVMLMIVHADGSTDQELVPKDGSSVTLQNPKTGTTKMWPINKLAGVEMNYPSTGFVPKILQKKIKLVIVDEEDWEPLINRDPNQEMVASPAMLGNLMNEKITEAVIRVNKEMMDSLSQLTKKLNRMVTPAQFFIGIGLIAIGVVALIFLVVPNIGDLAEGIEQIKTALGVTSG